MKTRRYKIVNKTRFYIFITVSLMLGAIITNILFSTAKAYSNPVESPYEEIIIAEGDTLWYIAIDFMPQNYDVREMIYNIKQLNNMETVSIFPGDKIKVPLIK